MKFFALIFVSFFIVNSAFAKIKKDVEFQEVAGWAEFEQTMKEAELRDKQIGWSYLISGLLVSIGGTLGAENTTDEGSKLIYGLSASFGLGAAGYGTIRLINGNSYTQFYNTLRMSSLTQAQRDELVRNYLEQEKEKERILKITRIVTHVAISGLNFYSASKEPDQNTKNFFHFLGAINLAMAFSYSF